MVCSSLSSVKHHPLSSPIKSTRSLEVPVRELGSQMFFGTVCCFWFGHLLSLFIYGSLPDFDAGEWPVNPEVHAIPLILKRISSFNGAICFDARKKETVGTSPGYLNGPTVSDPVEDPAESFGPSTPWLRSKECSSFNKNPFI